MSQDRIRKQVVEELYEETLLLADEARAAFDLRGREPSDSERLYGRVARLDRQIRHEETDGQARALQGRLSNAFNTP